MSENNSDSNATRQAKYCVPGSRLNFQQKRYCMQQLEKITVRVSE